MNSISLIPILEFSYTIRKDVQRGYPEPDMCGGTGWHCSICGEPVSGGHVACHMHEVGPRRVSGTFCVLSDNKIPDRAQQVIQFLLDNMIITLKHVMIRPASCMKGPKIVSSKPVDAQYKRVYYAFEASGIEHDLVVEE